MTNIYPVRAKTRENANSKEKDEENVSRADLQEKDVSGAESENTQSGVSVSEDISPAETTVASQPKAYISVDIRL